MRKILYSIGMVTVVLAMSCSKDFTVTDQGTTFSDDKILELVKYPEAAMAFTESIEAGAYHNMMKLGIGTGDAEFHEDFGQKAVDIMMDAMGTDLVFPSGAWFMYHYNYQGRTENTRANINYNYYAKLAHNANLMIRYASLSNPDFKQSSVYGRALAIRAFANFYQIRLLGFGDQGISYEYVDLENESKMVIRYERVPTQEVYAFIERDLLSAYDILQGFGRTNKGMIDQKIVSGILSRMYLELKNWPKAQDYALKALGGTIEAVPFNTLNNGFNDVNNTEIMWGAEVDGSNFTHYGSFFSHMDSFNLGYGSYSMTPKLIDQRLFAQIKENDVRRTWFYNGLDTIVSPSTGAVITGRNLIKLANIKFVDPTFFTGDNLFMRKSEMLLNYAEAAAENNQDGEAHKALNALMETRQPGYSADALTGQALIAEVRLQRRIELWGEGFGLLDLKRWGIGVDRKTPVVVDGETIESGHKYIPNTNFKFEPESEKLRFQFPISEINANPKLQPQNP